MSYHHPSLRRRSLHGHNFPTQELESHFDDHRHHTSTIIASHHNVVSSINEQQKQVSVNEAMSTSGGEVVVVPLGDETASMNYGLLVAGILLIVFGVTFLLCGLHNYYKRKHQREEQIRIMNSIFKYVQVFDIDDIDIKRTPAGGYEIIYLNDLATHGGNLAPVGKRSTKRRISPPRSGSSGRTPHPGSSTTNLSQSYAGKSGGGGGTPPRSPGSAQSPPPPPPASQGFSKECIQSLDLTDLSKFQEESKNGGGGDNNVNSPRPSTFQSSDDYMFMSKSIRVATESGSDDDAINSEDSEIWEEDLAEQE